MALRNPGALSHWGLTLLPWRLHSLIRKESWYSSLCMPLSFKSSLSFLSFKSTMLVQISLPHIRMLPLTSGGLSQFQALCSFATTLGQTFTHPFLMLLLLPVSHWIKFTSLFWFYLSNSIHATFFSLVSAPVQPRVFCHLHLWVSVHKVTSSRLFSLPFSLGEKLKAKRTWFSWGCNPLSWIWTYSDPQNNAFFP